MITTQTPDPFSFYDETIYECEKTHTKLRVYSPKEDKSYWWTVKGEDIWDELNEHKIYDKNINNTKFNIKCNIF